MEDRRLADGARVRRARARATSSAKHGGARARRARVAARDARGDGARRAAHARRSAATTSTSACARPISAATATARGIPWLGMPIADVDALDRVLVVGSFLRKDHPLLAQRLRQAAKKGAQVSLAAFGRRRLADAASRTRRSSRRRCCRRRWPRSSSRRRSAAGKPVPGGAGRTSSPSPRRKAIAASLAVGRAQGAILLGNFARAASGGVAAASRWRRRSPTSPARRSAASPKRRTASAATSRGALPQRAGMNAQAMLAEPRKAYLAAACRAGVRLRQSGRRARRAREGRASSS